MIDLFKVEIKLILRNKRPRFLAFGTIIFLFICVNYCYRFAIEPTTFNWVMMIAWCFFGINQFNLTYGLNSFGFSTVFFSALLKRKNYDIIRAKLLLLQVFCAIYFLPLVFFFPWFPSAVQWISFCFFIYSLGVNCMLVLFFSLSNRHRLDLNSLGGRFYYNPNNLKEFFIPFPLLFIFIFPQYQTWIAGIMMFLGLLSIFFLKKLIKIIYDKFNNKRYEIFASV